MITTLLLLNIFRKENISYWYLFLCVFLYFISIRILFLFFIFFNGWAYYEASFEPIYTIRQLEVIFFSFFFFFVRENCSKIVYKGWTHFYDLNTFIDNMVSFTSHSSNNVWPLLSCSYIGYAKLIKLCTMRTQKHTVLVNIFVGSILFRISRSNYSGNAEFMFLYTYLCLLTFAQ